MEGPAIVPHLNQINILEDLSQMIKINSKFKRKISQIHNILISLLTM